MIDPRDTWDAMSYEGQQTGRRESQTLFSSGFLSQTLLLVLHHREHQESDSLFPPSLIHACVCGCGCLDADLRRR